MANNKIKHATIELSFAFTFFKCMVNFTYILKGLFLAAAAKLKHINLLPLNLLLVR